MFHLITNTADGLQPRQLCSREQNGGTVLCFIAAQQFPIHLRRRVRMNNMC